MKTTSLLTIYICLIFAGCGAPVTKRVKVSNALIEKEARIQQEKALESTYKDQGRLYDVSYPLLRTGKLINEKKLRPLIGIYLHNKYVYNKDLRNAAVSLYNVGEDLQLMYVVKGSNADIAGLHPQDILKSVNNQPVPTGKNARKEIVKWWGKNVDKTKTIVVEVVRNGTKHKINVSPEYVCDFGNCKRDIRTF